MKKSLLFKTIILMILFAGLSSATWAQVLYEDFNYATPAFVGGNGATGTISNNWTTHSVTTGQTTTIDIQDGSLNYTGLAASTGNKVFLFGNANATSRDVNRSFVSVATTLYFSALVSVIDNSQITTSGDYFMCLGAAAGSSPGSLGGRLGVKSANGGLNFRFIIQNTSSGTLTYTDNGSDLNFGTTYLVVVKYDRNAVPTVASMWVNPVSLGAAEPSGFVSNSSGTASITSFGSICLRNSATTPKANIDEIRVGETWASVTPPVPTITVTAPVTGAQWEQGTTRNVTWTALATNTNVKIEFTPNASATPVVWSIVDDMNVKAASAGTYAIAIPVGDANVPVSADCQFRISDIPETAFGLSGIFSVIAPQPPVATFTPANGATAVDITSNITIAFDVPVRNIDNSEITDAQLASLVTLKTTDAAGTAVPFTATGDPLTRTITINPDADLLNSQVYYVAVAPVEGYNDLATVAQHITFTTIGSVTISDVTVAEVAPYIAGDAITVKWLSQNVSTVKIELVETATSTVTGVAAAVTASAGTASIVLPATLAYSAAYKVRVTDEATLTINSESSAFAVIAVANSLLALRAQPVDAIVKYTGIATVTYARTSRNQKYIQDGTAAILIDDPIVAPATAGVITGTYNVGDGITNLVGKIALYSGLIEFVPSTAGEPATGTVITPELRTLVSLTPADQCKLVRIENFSFKTPTTITPIGKFVKSKNYELTGYDYSILAYRTAFAESDYINGDVPTGTISTIGLVGQFTKDAVTPIQMQITARSWSDMSLITLTSPAAGVKVRQGETRPITWTASGTNTNVKIEFTGDASATTPTWTTLGASVAASAGTFDALIPVDLALSTDSKIRITDIPQTASSLSATFSIITQPIVAANIAALRSGTVGTEYKLTGEALLTFKQAARNQKFIEDATGAILIDDAAGVITTPHLVGDGITGITGTLFLNSDGMLEFIPTENTTASSSTANLLTPQVVTLAELAANFESYESELVQVKNCTFADAGANFANGQTYAITDQEGTAGKFLTTFSGVDYITQPISAEHMYITGIANSTGAAGINFNITSRNLADFMISTGVNDVTSAKMQLSISPNPGNGDITVTLPAKGTYDLKVYSLVGKIVYKTSMTGISGKLDLSDLPKGMYILNASNILTGKVNSSRLVIN